MAIIKPLFVLDIRTRVDRDLYIFVEYIQRLKSLFNHSKINVSYREKDRLVARNSRWKIERRVREIQDATRYLGSYSWLLFLAYYSCADSGSFVRRWGPALTKFLFRFVV